jgi:hypothetical protein
MSIPLSLIRGNFFVDRGSKINTATITNTDIYMNTDGTGILDMGGAVIQNAGTPSLTAPNPGDVVNIAYLQQYTSPTTGTGGTATQTVYTATLSGVIWSSPNISILTGTLFINIKSTTTGGPCATFSVSKSTSSSLANPIRLSSSSGNSTNEKLSLRWLANTTIQFSKSGSGYNGTYQIVLTIL